MAIAKSNSLVNLVMGTKICLEIVFNIIDNNCLRFMLHGLGAADFMVYVDNKKPELKEIATWLKSHSSKI